MKTNPERDVLIIHGHGLTPDEKPDAHTVQRMDTGIAAWREGVAPNIVVCGRHSFLYHTSLYGEPPRSSEAEAMLQYGLGKGIPEGNILAESQSLDTVGNALFSKTNHIMPNRWERLAVVTSDSHLARALKIFGHVYGKDFDITGIPAPEKTGIKERIWEPLGSVLVREILRGTKPGDHEAIQERLIDLVPGYGDGTLPRLAFRSLVGRLRRA